MADLSIMLNWIIFYYPKIGKKKKCIQYSLYSIVYIVYYKKISVYSIVYIV